MHSHTESAKFLAPEPLPHTYMADNPTLNDRSQFLFKVLMERYISEGSPVGSRTLARNAGLQLSPATIRNVMADLEDLGLVRSPHTSAGRIPTVQGYRLFIDSILQVQNLSEVDVQRLIGDVDPDTDISNLLKMTSDSLSEMTRLASVMMVPKTEHQELRQVEFLQLSDSRVLVILVINNSEVQNRIIHTDRSYSASELQQAANFLNQMFVGRDLDNVRKEILNEMDAAREQMDTMMQAVIEVTQKALTPDEGTDDLVVSGQTHLMEVDELSNVEKLRGLFEAFNEKRGMLHLLDQALNAEGVQIFIGEESGFEIMDDFSLVTSTYEVDGDVLGVLGVIGPTRMAYERVIPIVDMTARMLSANLKSRN